MKIAEYNILIAEFTGNRHSQSKVSFFNYHHSWDYLIPVIAKIKDSDPKDKAIHLIDKIDEGLMQTNIGYTYEAVCVFIEWYNKQKIDLLEGINYKLLRDQKRELLENVVATENMKGLINLIDEIQDYAVDVMGMRETEVFGTKS